MSTVGWAWPLLIVAGLLEIVWAVSLKRADGLTRVWPTVVGLAAMIASAGLLTLTLRVLPVGTAYVAWVGVGAMGVALTGILAFGEEASYPRLICLALILAGIVGLRMIEA
jgi:quaternary ammonium compound-resistance protein SugE